MLALHHAAVFVCCSLKQSRTMVMLLCAAGGDSKGVEEGLHVFDMAQ